MTRDSGLTAAEAQAHLEPAWTEPPARANARDSLLGVARGVGSANGPAPVPCTPLDALDTLLDHRSRGIDLRVAAITV